MNAAFLLVTTAWLAGDYPVIQPVSTTEAGTSCGHGHYYGGCGNSCDPCCEEKKGFFAKLRDRFKKKDKCCDPCAPANCCPTYAPCQKQCCPTDCCDPCAKKKRGLLQKLKDLFKKKDKCCDACGCDHGCGCGHHGCGHGHIHGEMPTTPPEKLKLPKADPKEGGKDAPKSDKKGSINSGGEPPINEVRITTPPSAPAIVTPRVVVPNAQAVIQNPF